MWLAGITRRPLFGPFSRKQNSKHFDAASLLDIEELSPVFSSTNSSFSIIKLIERFSSSPVPLKKVYSNIESLLIKDAQDLSKQQGIEGLSHKYIVVRQEDLLH